MKTPFLMDILEEHLDEASYLHEQRMRTLDDPEASWTGMEDLEARLEPHVDGLVLAGEWGLKACTDRDGEAEPGELYTVVRVFCRNGRKDLVLDALHPLDPQDGDRMRAVTMALRTDMPGAWLEDFLGRGDPRLAAAAADTAAYRRMDAAGLLLAALHQAEPEALQPIVRALGRLTMPEAARAALHTLMDRGDAPVCMSAAIALLRAGQADAVSVCLGRASETWPLLPLALAGGRDAAGKIVDLLARGASRNHCHLALGLLGDASAVDALMGNLVDPDSAESAAMGLELVTGAGLVEEVTVPDGDEPAGTGAAVLRVSRDQGQWRAWWAANRQRFAAGARYRGGRPCGPRVLVEALACPATTNRLRDLVAEELVIRYGMDIPFEADMPVADQRRALAGMYSWLDANAGRFVDGAWFCAGRKLG